MKKLKRTFFHLQFEDAAKEVADEITRPRPEGEEDVNDIQVMLSSNANPCGLRELKVEIDFVSLYQNDLCMYLNESFISMYVLIPVTTNGTLSEDTWHRHCSICHQGQGNQAYNSVQEL